MRLARIQTLVARLLQIQIKRDIIEQFRAQTVQKFKAGQIGAEIVLQITRILLFSLWPDKEFKLPKRFCTNFFKPVTCVYLYDFVLNQNRTFNSTSFFFYFSNLYFYVTKIVVDHNLRPGPPLKKP